MFLTLYFHIVFLASAVCANKVTEVEKKCNCKHEKCLRIEKQSFEINFYLQSITRDEMWSKRSENIKMSKIVSH